MGLPPHSSRWRQTQQNHHRCWMTPAKASVALRRSLARGGAGIAQLSEGSREGGGRTGRGARCRCCALGSRWLRGPRSPRSPRSRPGSDCTATVGLFHALLSARSVDWVDHASEPRFVAKRLWCARLGGGFVAAGWSVQSVRGKGKSRREKMKWSNLFTQTLADVLQEERDESWKG